VKAAVVSSLAAKPTLSINTGQKPTPSNPPVPTLHREEEIQSWPASSPEEQGMDSARLASLLQVLRNDGRNIHSLLIARHGVLVLEVYFSPFQREALHNLYSCTKSVTSAAVGLALRDGLLESVDTPAIEYFPDLSLDDEAKRDITLRHLLTMSSGLEWSEPLRSGLSDTWSLTDNDSPEEYFFSRPQASAPGSVFNYNTGGSHLLSMIVGRSSGGLAADYVERELFAPLGISPYVWLKDTPGNTLGGTGLALSSMDMLRFGQLYLQNGAWNGRQIIPEEWVRESTHAHIRVDEEVGYGYQWWVRPNGLYNALGWGGQEIIIAPAQDMVIVFTAGIRDAAWNTYDDLLQKYILPAARSSSALPPDPTGSAALAEQMRTIANPPVQTPGEIPPLAREISGKTYVDLNGTHGWSTFAFHFEKPDEAGLNLMYGLKSEDISATIGLDCLYRVTDTQNYGPLALRGYWKDADTFVLEQQFLMEAERIVMEMTFNGREIKRTSHWTVEDYSEESDAVLLNP